MTDHLHLAAVLRWVFNFHQVFSLSKIDWLQIESHFEKDEAKFYI